MSSHDTRPNERHNPSQRDEYQRDSDERSASDDGDRPDGEHAARLGPETLAAQIELLADENARLRERYASARKARYRKTAAGLVLIGAVAIASGFALPAGQEVLLVLGATGLFGGLLTAYLTPERFVAASVGERVYAALAANHAALIDELGLRVEPHYLPGSAGTGPQVFVPQRSSTDRPTDETGPIVTDEQSRGLLLEPTGASLYTAFADGTSEEPATAPAALATQLAEAIVELFELARHVDPDADGRRITFAVTDGAFGPLDRFDHPIPSFLAAGLAIGLDRPIRLTVYPGDNRADWLVTCWWAEPGDD